MTRWDEIGVFWEDLQIGRTRGARVLGPMPAIPETGWLPPTEFPNIRYAPWIGVDCETYDPELIDFGPGWGRGKGHICGVSIAVPWGKWYFPIRHTVQPELNLDAAMLFSWLAYSLSGSQPKIGAHLLYDIGWLAQEGVTVNGPLYDVQFAEGLLDETARVALEELGERYLFRGKKSELLKDWIMSYYMPPVKYWRREIYRSPITLVGPYAEEDASMPQQILIRQWPELVRRGLLDLFEMECRLIRLLIAMRFNGIAVDLGHAQRCRDQFTEKADLLHGLLEHTAGCKINVNAGDSLAKAFDRHNIPYGTTPTGKPSFTADILKTINHPIPKLVLAERRLRKLVSTFIDGYIFDAHVNGKVYCSFHPMLSEHGGAKTGRFSSSDPNLQNIPIRTPEGKEMRAIFTKDEGHKCYRSGDYSQVEYRILAHYAVGHHSIPGSYEAAEDVRRKYNEDPKLDYHEMVSSLINALSNIAIQLKSGAILPGLAIAGAEYLVREHIKTLNFAMVYGVGKVHLAEMLGVDLIKGQEISRSFHKAVPFARSTMTAISEEVAQTGICTTFLNRQTHFDYWEPDTWGESNAIPLLYKDALEEYGSQIRRAYLYAALNYRIQGTAADVMKKGMLDCWEQGIFAETGVPRLTVHDELGFSDAGYAREEAWQEMTHVMENTIKFSVPLRFDLKSGDNWKEAKG